VLCVSLFVIVLDNTILNVALPTLAHVKNEGGLGSSASQLQWIVDSYTLVFAGLLLTAGSLGDRFGRYRALALGLAVFGAGSVLSAFAGSPGMLIATRSLMGIGGAFIMPSTLSILTNVFTASQGWTSQSIVAGFVVGALLLAAFFVWELNTPNPMLDMHFFENPRFSAASGAIMLTFFAMFGTLFVMTQYFQLVLGYSTVKAGA